jgi:CRISPR-associated protein Csm4
MRCYRLNFTAPFHIDSRGNHFYEESNCFIHSDTLSSAILANWAMIYPEQMDQIIACPPYKISSAFPFYINTYFLPRPHSSQVIQLADDQLKQAKKLKKIQWLDIPLWKSAWTKADWAQQIDLDNGICQQVLASIDKNLPDKLWVEEQRPRLAMDRYTNQSIDGQLFNFSRIWFHQQGGLYFLAHFNDDNSRQRFEAVLSVLADSGIGADRSNGNGFFQWSSAEIPEISQGEHQMAVALSLVNPSPADCQTGWLKNAAYKLITRGGWIGGTGLRKPGVRMFTEGSVFSQPLQGRMIDVSLKDRPVYRDGRGFFINAG